MVNRKGEVYTGILNCFGKTPKGKPRNCRVEYFAPDIKDPRKSTNVGNLELVRRRDGYAYGTIKANLNLHKSSTMPDAPAKVHQESQLTFDLDDVRREKPKRKRTRRILADSQDVQLDFLNF